MSVVVRCHAKINPFLRVVRRRADGHHDLDLEFVPLALHDTVSLERAAATTLEVAGALPDDVPVQGNLVLRAVESLRSELGAGAVPPVRIVLEKRIPAAAGLGGGSSDAAGTLLGLVRLLDLDVAPGLLGRLARGLGADVPYFLVGGRQRGTERGDALVDLEDRPSAPVLLACVRPGLATRDVFEAHAALVSGGAGSLTTRKMDTSFWSGNWWQAPVAVVHSDLWPAAVSLMPGLEAMRRALGRALPEASVGMTGSGPTLFALLPPGAAVADTLARAREALPGTSILPTRTLTRSEQQLERFRPPGGRRDEGDEGQS